MNWNWNCLDAVGMHSPERPVPSARVQSCDRCRENSLWPCGGMRTCTWRTVRAVVRRATAVPVNKSYETGLELLPCKNSACGAVQGPGLVFRLGFCSVTFCSRMAPLGLLD